MPHFNDVLPDMMLVVGIVLIVGSGISGCLLLAYQWWEDHDKEGEL